MLQKLIALLLNHPQVGPRLVQSLSESYPIRRAAKFTAYLYLRGKQAIEEGAKHDITQSTLHNAQKAGSSFKDNFKAELRKGWEEAKRKKY